MKAILLGALLVCAVAFAFAPTVEARNFCVAGVDSWCPGLYCKWDAAGKQWKCFEPHVDCVTEPCPCTCPPERLLP